MKKIMCLMFGLFLASCAQEDLEDKPLSDVYEDAMESMLNGAYQKAAETFGDVERQYPYNDWAKKSQVMAAYCYYMARKSEQAVGTLDAFVKMNPSHSLTPYATYLLGVIYYGRISDPKRDHKVAEKALNAFEFHLKRFPSTIYARDVKKKIIILKEVLAAKEIEVGRYYQQQGAYIAALMRFQTVLEKHAGSKYVPESYYRMVELFFSFGDFDRANEVMNILEKKYPTTLWTEKARELKKSIQQK